MREEIKLQPQYISILQHKNQNKHFTQGWQ